MSIPIEIINQIDSLNTPAIVAVSGFGGAGKSTFSEALGRELNIPVIGVDYFYKGDDFINYSNWECMDYDRLKNDVCIPFLNGNKEIIYREYDWERKLMGKSRKVLHSGKIIIEGIGLFRPELNKYFTYKLWIDCRIDEAIRRGKNREIARNNAYQNQLWDGIWRKNDEEYYSKYKPNEIADKIINN